MIFHNSSSDCKIIEYIKSHNLFLDADPRLPSLFLELSEQVELCNGDILFREGDKCDSIYILLSGTLLSSTESTMSRHHSGNLYHAGSLLGVIETLTGGFSVATILSSNTSILLKLSKMSAEQIEHSFPDFYQRLIDSLKKEMLHRRSAAVFKVMFGDIFKYAALSKLENLGEWIFLKKGEILYSAEDPGDSFFIIIAGRLKAVFHEQHAVIAPEWELFSADCIGEISFLMGEKRNRTVQAIRDSYLLKYSRSAARVLIKKYPRILVRITQLLVNHLRTIPIRPSGKKNLRNFAIIPAGKYENISTFSQKFAESLEKIGPTLHLTPDTLDRMTGIPGIAYAIDDGIYNFSMIAWLDSMEDSFSYIIFQSDGAVTPWTKKCINYCDHIIIAVGAGGSLDLGDIESELLFSTNVQVTQQKTLSLIHPQDTKLPRNTSLWLHNRPVDRTINIREDCEGDYDRLARIETGNAICLVLSGGGARGYAHIGVIRALEILNIPIDIIGGTSQGAGIGLAKAFGYNSNEITDISKNGFVYYNPLRDYTFPFISLLKGKDLENVHRGSCGETDLEDLWINYFCIACNLTKSDIAILEKGPAWKALRATSSIPGLLPPVIYDGEIHVDGGLINNLPIDIMKRKASGIIIASDTSFVENPRVDEEKYPGPMKIFFRKINPFSKSQKVPNIKDLLMQATTLSSVDNKRKVADNVDLYLTPPVREYDILDMKKVDEISEVGYRYALDTIAEWKKTLPLASASWNKEIANINSNADKQCESIHFPPLK